MCKSIISAILFLGLLANLPLNANDLILRNNIPDRYVVVPGDTLWDISSRFLVDPWRWPEIWELNQAQVKNPHKIYPGDIVVIENTPHGKRLRLANEKGTVKLSPKLANLANNRGAEKLSPRIRVERSGLSAIPSIPAAAIEPFLSQPLIVDKDRLENAPFLLGSSDNRVILSAGNTVYASGLPEQEGSAWQIFRPGKALKDPDNDGRILGYEATYLGNIRLEVFADISTMTITRSVEEILQGDRLVPAPGIIFNNYVPHAPELPINGRIISVYGGVTEIGRGAIITLNKGASDGLEMGHVLAVYRRSQVRSLKGEIVTLPDERTGLVFVFRVFDRIAYALVMQSTHSIQILDAVKTPR